MEVCFFNNPDFFSCAALPLPKPIGSRPITETDRLLEQTATQYSNVGMPLGGYQIAEPSSQSFSETLDMNPDISHVLGDQLKYLYCSDDRSNYDRKSL